MELHNAVRPVKYSEILELDRRITECTPPPFLNIPPEGSSMEEDGPLLIMQRMLPPVCRDGREYYSFISPSPIPLLSFTRFLTELLFLFGSADVHSSWFLREGHY